MLVMEQLPNCFENVMPLRQTFMGHVNLCKKELKHKFCIEKISF